MSRAEREAAAARLAETERQNIARTRELRTSLADLGGFERIEMANPYPPMACTVCGCLIAAEYAPAHRERCTA